MAVVGVVLAAGCGGGDAAEEPVFTTADATRIVDVRPVAAGWTWPEEAERHAPSDASESESADPLVVELKRRMADLVALGDVANKWQDDDKLGNLAIGVYGSAADAHEAMAAMNAFSRAWGEQNGTVTMEEEVDDLGDEAWRLGVAANGAQVTYHWRRANLVLEAHVHCFGSCPGDVDAAARVWVDAIDNAAEGGR